MTMEPAPFHPVAVTGMHRSGTSMVTRGLHQSGLHLVGGDADALLAAADDNPEGFWENKAIVACNDDLLEAAGGAWDNPPALLPMAVDDPRLTEVVEPATTALAGLAENEKWGFKDPRTCLTAAFWLDLQPDLRFVISVRSPLEVALSLKRRNQNSYSLGLSLWERYYAAILEVVPIERRIVTHYDSYFLDPVGELARVCDFVGLQPAQLDVRADLRHHDVGVSLDEANVTAPVRDLYHRLCEEAAAVTPPSSVPDEGRVRRLVLDGTVAARHAEQRQAAIERLEDRLADARRVESQLRDDLTTSRREFADVRSTLTRREHELQVLRAELDRLRADTNTRVDRLVADQQVLLDQSLRLVDTTDTLAEMTHGLIDRTHDTADRLERTATIVDAIHVKVRAVDEQVRPGILRSFGRRVNRVLRRGAGAVSAPTRRAASSTVAQSVPVATRTTKAAARRMPTPVRHNIHRVRRAVAAGQAGNRVRERSARLVARLPPPARTVARRGAGAARRSGVGPATSRAAYGIGRRLPAPARRAVRSMVSIGSPTPRRVARPVSRAAPAPRPRRELPGRPVEVPKGPPAFKWQKGYERLVAEFVEPGMRWAVATPGIRVAVDRVGNRTATPFPMPGAALPPADSLSLIAVLEARRAEGHQRLVVPEGSRPWLAGHPAFSEHLGRAHRLVVDRPGAGAVFDLVAEPAGEHQGLLAEILALVGEGDALPSVLNWTEFDLMVELSGVTTFRPPDGATLPYFDDSIEVVVVADATNLAEARRVATIAVFIVDPSVDVPRIVGVESIARSPHPTPTVVVTVPEVPAAAAGALLEKRVADSGASLVIAGADSELATADVVVALEADVVPLPGAIAALVSSVTTDPATIWTGKVIDGRGRIEGAGATVFADGSLVGIAGGSLDVRAPWHEFVRPVCWGAGILAATPRRWAEVAQPATTSFADIGARAWATGRPVQYQPDAAVVRVGAWTPPPIGEWTDQLRARPDRPDDLGDGGWRYLLANDSAASGSEAGR